jgi:hypothetical protein
MEGPSTGGRKEGGMKRPLDWTRAEDVARIARAENVRHTIAMLIRLGHEDIAGLLEAVENRTPNTRAQA